MGIADQLPSARRVAKPVRLTLAAAVLLDPRGRTLLIREDAGKAAQQGRIASEDAVVKEDKVAFFSRLWQFPAVNVSRDAKTEIAKHIGRVLGLEDFALEPTGTARHAVTFHDIRLVPFLARVERLPRIAGSRRPKLAKLDPLPISNATRKIAAAALAAL
jgi:hypothetical protein